MAEVSKIGNLCIGEIGCCELWMAGPTDRWIERWFAPQRCASFRHVTFKKSSETVRFEHFCSHLEFKSGPRPSHFNTFEKRTCFAPQRHEFFRIWNAKMVQDRQFLAFLHLFTCEHASRHNAVHFLDISTSKSVARPSV